MQDFYARAKPRIETLVAELQAHDGLEPWQCANVLLAAAISLGTGITSPARTAFILRDIANRRDADARQRDATRRARR